MRNELYILRGQQITVTATFVKKCITDQIIEIDSNRIIQEIIKEKEVYLFENIYDLEGNLLTDHLYLRDERVFKAINLEDFPNSSVMFSGRVSRYKTKNKQDFEICGIHKFHIINDSDNIGSIIANNDIKNQPSGETIDEEFYNYCIDTGRHLKTRYISKNINAASDKTHALYWACEVGRIDLVKRLMVDIEVDPSSKRNNALTKALFSNNIDIVLLLLNDKRVIERGKISWFKSAREALKYLKDKDKTYNELEELEKNYINMILNVHA